MLLVYKSRSTLRVLIFSAIMHASNPYFYTAFQQVHGFQSLLKDFLIICCFSRRQVCRFLKDACRSFWNSLSAQSSTFIDSDVAGNILWCSNIEPLHTRQKILKDGRNRPSLHYIAAALKQDNTTTSISPYFVIHYTLHTALFLILDFTKKISYDSEGGAEEKNP
jgi:hypothetical protein